MPVPEMVTVRSEATSIKVCIRKDINPETPPAARMGALQVGPSLRNGTAASYNSTEKLVNGGVAKGTVP